ncbi:MAG TPA: matrixin family metalloprotease [Myxococcales bacterium]|nr:matrixin family metalloprotease [Myxococcales bacterium]
MRFATVLAVAALCCPAARAYELQLDASGSPQRVEGTVQYAVNQGGSRDLTYAQILPAVHAAFASWTAAGGGRLAFQDVGPTQLGPPGPDDARLGIPVTISWEQTAWDYDGDDQAVAILVEDPDSHVIVRADIVFNDVTHHWAVLDDGQPHPGADDVQNTLTHEIGHLLGFGHTPDPTSTMLPSTYPGDLARRTIDAQDVAGIEALYAATPSSEEQAEGCATGPGAPSQALLLLLASILVGRRRSGGR